MMASAREEIYDVVVIGGGWSGLLACKHAKERNLSVRVLEKREDLGGVWKFSSDSNITTVMKNSCTSSSSTLTEISDYPMPIEIGEFPKHQDIYKYLNSYADKHNLRKNIHFNCNVTKIHKDGSLWIIVTNNKTVYNSKNVIVCSGVHLKGNTSLEDTVLRGYKGTVIHAGELKGFKEEHQGKRIMLIGGGETASDILDEYHSNVDLIIWCVPRGQHFFRKYSKILPHRKPQALDKASSRALKLIAPQTKSKPGLAWVCKWTTNGSFTAYQGHGIPEFRNNANFFHSFINKHAHALDYIDYKKVIPKGAIDYAQGKTVYFKDGSVHEIDVIIQCTGYQAEFPFLSPKYKIVLSDLYKFVYFVEDTSLSFIGFVRPIVGSIPGLSEIQARWVCQVISGKTTLANLNTRIQTVATDKLYWENYFKDTSKRISTLVEGYTYVDQLAKLSGCFPNYWELFKNNPKDFFTAYFAPYNACSLLLNDESKREEALKTLKRHSSDTITAFNIITILFIRLFMFDWFCDILGTVKYKIQTNNLWKCICEWRVIRLLDYIWCTPKRYLFDNVTRI